MDYAQRAVEETAHAAIYEKNPSVKTIGNESICRGCGEIIYWAITANDKRAPFDPDGISHFATCKAASKFRRPKQ